MKERNGIVPFRMGMCKLRRIRRGAEKGRCPLCKEEENEVCALWKCKEIQT
jgi:hypothetical protein